MSVAECPKCAADLPTPTPRFCPDCGEAIPRYPTAKPKVALAKAREEEAEPTDPPPVFDVREYAAKPGASLLGILAMGVVGMFAAGLVGAIGSSIGQCFYLIVLFPIVMGFAVGAAMMVAAKKTKMHSPGIAGLLGLWCGVCTALAVHVCDYLWSMGSLPPGVTSFPDFVKWEATEGVRLGTKGGGINLGYTGSFIYWGIEMLIIAGLVFLVCFGTAGSPFCTECDEWKEERTYGPIYAGVEKADKWLQAGKLARLAKKPKRDEDDDDDEEDDPPDTHLELLVYVCPNCKGDGEIDIQLKSVKVKKDDKTTTDHSHTTYPGEALPWVKKIAKRASKN
jgi:hypothetical protein